jgi:hypothetical protein
LAEKDLPGHHFFHFFKLCRHESNPPAVVATALDSIITILSGTKARTRIVKITRSRNIEISNFFINQLKIISN